MTRWITPADWWRLSWRMAAMTAEAQTVIALRLLGFAGMWHSPPFEAQRMVAEKAQAAREAGLAGTVSLMRGEGPARATLAALAPVGRRTRANARRLTRTPRSGPTRKS